MTAGDGGARSDTTDWGYQSASDSRYCGDHKRDDDVDGYTYRRRNHRPDAYAKRRAEVRIGVEAAATQGGIESGGADYAHHCQQGGGKRGPERPPKRKRQ